MTFCSQILLSLPSTLLTSERYLCPTMRAFKFPSGCVCHAQTSETYKDRNSSHSEIIWSIKGSIFLMSVSVLDLS